MRSGDRRGGGKLPAHMVAYLTMRLCLFGKDDYEEVATKVTGVLNRWGTGMRRGGRRPQGGSARLPRRHCDTNMHPEE